MSASRRAPKPRYLLTQDRDRIALAAATLCAIAVMTMSIFVQRHPLLETILRAGVALVVTYAAVAVAAAFALHLRRTQSVVDEESETEVKDSETE